MCEQNKCHTIWAVSKLPYAFARAPPLSIANHWIYEWQNIFIAHLHSVCGANCRRANDRFYYFRWTVSPLAQWIKWSERVAVGNTAIHILRFKETAKIVHFRFVLGMPSWYMSNYSNTHSAPLLMAALSICRAMFAGDTIIWWRTINCSPFLWI